MCFSCKQWGIVVVPSMYLERQRGFICMFDAVKWLKTCFVYFKRLCLRQRAAFSIRSLFFSTHISHSDSIGIVFYVCYANNVATFASFTISHVLSSEVYAVHWWWLLSGDISITKKRKTLKKDCKHQASQ